MLAEAILVHGEIGYKFCWLLPSEDWIRRHQLGTNQNNYILERFFQNSRTKWRKGKCDLEKPHQVKERERWFGEATPLKEGFPATQERQGCLKSDLHTATKDISTLLYKNLNTSCSRRGGTVQPHLKKKKQKRRGDLENVRLLNSFQITKKFGNRTREFAHQHILHGEHFQHQLHVTAGGHLLFIAPTTHIQVVLILS